MRIGRHRRSAGDPPDPWCFRSFCSRTRPTVRSHAPRRADSVSTTPRTRRQARPAHRVRSDPLRRAPFHVPPTTSRGSCNCHCTLRLRAPAAHHVECNPLTSPNVPRPRSLPLTVSCGDVCIIGTGPWLVCREFSSIRVGMRPRRSSDVRRTLHGRIPQCVRPLASAPARPGLRGAGARVDGAAARGQYVDGNVSGASPVTHPGDFSSGSSARV
jgi:hypothetical protein